MKKYLLGIAIMIALIFAALLALLQQLDIDIGPPVPRQPCEFTGPIKLKLGETQVSFPEDAGLLITEADGPWASRRRVRSENLFAGACFDNKPYRVASNLSKDVTFFSRADTLNIDFAKQRRSGIYVSLFPNEPRFMADGIYETERTKRKDGSYRRDFTEQTGYKSDASDCYVLEKTGMEKCHIYRYLEDVDLTISMLLNPSKINAYGQPVYSGDRLTREHWPELMDKEEEYWRAFIVVNDNATSPD